MIRRVLLGIGIPTGGGKERRTNWFLFDREVQDWSSRRYDPGGRSLCFLVVGVGLDLLAVRQGVPLTLPRGRNSDVTLLVEFVGKCRNGLRIRHAVGHDVGVFLLPESVNALGVLHAG